MNLYKFAYRLSPILTVYLLVVSLGLPLHKVYCACKGETGISLFSEPHHCGHKEVLVCGDDYEASSNSTASSHVVNKVAKADCCSSLATQNCQGEDHDCGGSETVLAKFTPDYILAKKLDFSVLPLIDSPLFTASFIQTKQIVSALVFTAFLKAADIPLPYGRDLLIREQVFLC